MKSFVYILIFLSFSGLSSAVENKTQSIDTLMNKYDAQNQPQDKITFEGNGGNTQTLTDRQINLNYKLKALLYASVLAISIIISILVFFYFAKHFNTSSADILNTIALVLIVFGTICLSIVVDTSEQLTASIGILGAIAGYLFGTMKSSSGGNRIEKNVKKEVEKKIK